MTGGLLLTCAGNLQARAFYQAQELLYGMLLRRKSIFQSPSWLLATATVLRGCPSARVTPC